MLQADAYTGFNELYRDGRITEAACWAHTRRKIHDVHVRTPPALTDEALKRFGELYTVEAEICKQNGVDPERYLRHVLDVIADWPASRVSERLPWCVALSTE